MDGFSFVEHLHADPALHDVPVVVVTGRELTPEEQARLETQVARVLQKGNFDRSALLRTVARVVAPVGEV
jgi:CheY-like chemotaxis protein